MNSPLLALALLCPVAFVPQSQEDETDAHGYDKMRIEQEDKLLVPMEIKDAVWEYLRTRLTEDKEFLASLDPLFTATWNEELFHDTYFDTPSLQLHAMQSGVRHRKRENITNPDDVKSGRELMQIKLNDISSNELERAEIKYDIDRMPKRDTPEGRHPTLGRVKEEHRKPFKDRLEAIGLDPQSMQPILTVVDVRRRVYLKKNGNAFMSISFDQVQCDLLWAHVEFCEIEPELNEIGFTEADEATRTYMESVLAKVVGDIRAKFPEIQQVLTPKYNKSFDRLEAEIPMLRTLVKVGLHDDGAVLLVFGGVLVVLVVATVPRLLRGKRDKKKGPAPLAGAAPQPRREHSPVA